MFRGKNMDTALTQRTLFVTMLALIGPTNLEIFLPLHKCKSCLPFVLYAFGMGMRNTQEGINTCHPKNGNLKPAPRVGKMPSIVYTLWCITFITTCIFSTWTVTRWINETAILPKASARALNIIFHRLPIIFRGRFKVWYIKSNVTCTCEIRTTGFGFNAGYATL